MTEQLHRLGRRLNEVNFEHLGEQKKVVDFTEFTQEGEKVEYTNGDDPLKGTIFVKMGRIHFEDGSEMEMEIYQIRQMIDHYEKAMQ